MPGSSAGRPSWAGALVAVPGAVTAYMAQPDNFGLYLFLGALALWLCGRGLAGDRRAFVVGGLVVGLASLARNDGILLGVPVRPGVPRRALAGVARGRRGPVGRVASAGRRPSAVRWPSPW